LNPEAVPTASREYSVLKPKASGRCRNTAIQLPEEVPGNKRRLYLEIPIKGMKPAFRKK
jgi:hypothetical protein